MPDHYLDILAVSHFHSIVQRSKFRIHGVFGFYIGCIVFQLLCTGSAAFSQSCTRYLNATDGDDRRAGTSASTAVRTLEHAFKSFPSGAVVCMTAGEYFQGTDADGVQLSGASAEDKSMTFVLQTFAGNDVVGITEDEFVVDIGSGTITFSAGSTSKLFFGEGTVNNATDFPGHTNYLHSLLLLSGTVDVEGVDLIIGRSVGNPFFQGSPTQPPDGAAIVRRMGVLKGLPQFPDAFRRIRYVGQGDREAGSELPTTNQLDIVFDHAEGTVSIPRSLNIVEGGIEGLGSGSARFVNDVTFTEPAAAAITSTGDGSLYFTSVTVFGSGDLQLINVQDGIVEIEHLEATALNAPTDVDVSVADRGGLILRSILTPPNVSGSSAELHAANFGVLSVGSIPANPPIALHVVNRTNASLLLSGDVTFAGGILNEGRMEIRGSSTFQDDVINRGSIFVGDEAGGMITVTLENTFENTGTVDLDSHELLLTSPVTHSNTGRISGGTVVLAGDVRITGDGFLPSLEARSGESGVADQEIEGGIQCRPPAGLHLDAIGVVKGTIKVNCRLTHAGSLEVNGDLQMEGGSFSITDATRVTGDYRQRSGTTLTIEAATLSLVGDFVRAGGAVQVDEGEIAFVGDRIQRFETGPNLVMHHLSISGAGIDLIAATPTNLTGDLVIADNSRLTMVSGRLRLVGSSSAARLSGRLLTGSSQSVEFSGPTGSAQTLEGSGVVGNLLINLGNEDDGVTVVGTGITQSGVLTLQRGSLVVAPSASLVLSPELDMPHVSRNLGDENFSGEPDGRGIVANVSGAGNLDAPAGLDVSYYGRVTDTADAGAELSSGNVRNLTIHLETLSGERGTLRILHDVILSGNVTVGATTNVDIAGYTLSARGADSEHVIDGSIGHGEFLIEGTGTVRGTVSNRSWLDDFTVRSSGTVEADAAGSVRAVNLIRGHLSLKLPVNQDVGSYWQDGADTRLQLRSVLGISEEFRVDQGNVQTGPFDVVLSSGAQLSNATGARWDAEGRGHLVFAGNGLVGGEETVLPRLKLAGGTSDVVRLSGTLRITSSLVHDSGSLDLSGNTLDLAGRLWTVRSGTYSGGGTVVVPGNLDAEFSQNVSVPHLVIGDANAPSVFSIRSRTNAPVAIRAGRVQLLGGVTDLGDNDLLLAGDTPRLIAAGGLFQMITASSVDPEENGEVVFEAPGTIQLDANLWLPNLRLEGDVLLTGAPRTLTVIDRITFASGSLSGAPGQLVLEDGISLVRSANGVPHLSPVLRGQIDVYYYTDGRSIAKALNTGPELPSQVRDLIIDGGMGASGSENTIRLSQSVRVQRKLRLVSGVFDAAGSSIRMAAGSEVLVDYQRQPMPRFADGTSYLTEGPITLTYLGKAGDLSSDNRTFPSDADIDNLVVRMGDLSSDTPRHFRLHGLRRVDRLIIDHFTEESSFDLNGATLLVDSVTDVAAGRLTSNMEGILEIGGDFLVRTGALANGVLAVSVEGASIINGIFQGHILSARGNVTVNGSLGGPNRILDANADHYVSGLPNLIMRGGDQVLTISSSEDDPSSTDDAVNRLTVNLDSVAGVTSGPSLNIRSNDAKGVLLGVNHLELAQGLVRTGHNVLVLPSNGDGFSQASTSVVSHVVGGVRRDVDAGQPNPFTKPHGRFLFPVGADYPHAVYRPVALVFKEETPASAALSVTVAHDDKPPGGLRGFPIGGGDDIVLDDTAPFHWVIQSSQDFPPGQVFTLEFLATELSEHTSVRRTRMIRRSTKEADAGWRLHASPSEYDNARVTSDGVSAVFIQTADVVDGLSSDSTFFTVGLELGARDFSRVQFVHDAPAESVDLRINDDVVFAGLQPREATPYLRLGPGDHEFRLEEDGIDVIREPLLLASGKDYVVVATGRGSGLRRGIFVYGDAKATVDQGVEENAQINLFNGYGTSLDVSFSKGTPAEMSFSGIRPGGFLESYIDVPPDLLKFDIKSGDDIVSHRADLRRLSGLTAIVLVAAGTEEALVVSSEGDRLNAHTVVSDEDPTTLPAVFALHGNFPNPFNPTTQISFDLPEPASVSVDVFDVTGRRVISSDAGGINGGTNRRIEVDARHLPSGVYVYRVIARSATASYSGSGRFTLVK